MTRKKSGSLRLKRLNRNQIYKNISITLYQIQFKRKYFECKITTWMIDGVLE